jgi:uncharacterized protein (DUF302 family)
MAGVWLAVLVLFVGTACAEEPPRNDIVRYTVDGDFAGVKDALEMAIVNQGLVISSESRIDEMLKRTAEDLGIETRVYEHAVAFEFCSANYSRRMMEADPHNVVFCPFVIAVYQPAGQSAVYVAYRRPQLPAAGDEVEEALDAVADLLDTIAREATNW